MGGAAVGPPAWIERFLSAAFYAPCAVHGGHRKWCNLYCTDCLRPLCTECRDDEEGHCRRQSHVILQVVRSSYRAAVQIDGVNGIGKLFDGEDDIQAYRANRVRIFYLHSRVDSGGRVDSGRSGPYHCEACGWPLLDHDKRFCSIGCKIQPEEQQRRRGRQVHGGEVSLERGGGSTEAASEESSRGDKRKSKCPRRSPMH